MEVGRDMKFLIYHDDFSNQKSRSIFHEGDAPKRAKRIYRIINKYMHYMQRTASQKLRGGNPLFVRSGALKKNLYAHAILLPNNNVQGDIGIPAFVWYGKLHEFGGTVSVPGYTRIMEKIAGKKLGFPLPVEVKAHQRVVPQRAWLHPSFEQWLPELKKTLMKIDVVLTTKTMSGLGGKK
jgi:hypothetical protein